MRAVGMHIFAGGFAVGVQRAGFNVDAHYEAGTYGVATFKHNFPGVPVHTDAAAWPAPEGQVDLLYANPPCAPFSVNASKKLGAWSTDPRVECIYQVIEAVDDWRPKTVCMESVTRLYTHAKADVLDGLIGAMLAMGYNVYHVLHNARDFDLPQERKRYMLVLSLVELDPQDMLPSGADKPVMRDFADAINMAEDVRGLMYSPTANCHLHCLNNLLPHAEQGETLRKVHMRLYPGVKRGRPQAKVIRLHPDRPCGVVLGDVRFAHPDENRFLGLHETAALSGFDPDFQFLGSFNPASDLISRGVCPNVGAGFANWCRRGLQANVPAQGHEVVVDALKGEVTRVR